MNCRSMAQLERLQRHGDSETTTTHEPKKLTTSTSPTMEHYLRGIRCHLTVTYSPPVNMVQIFGL